MEVKVVIGSNYGDEGKGLVSANLAHNAKSNNKKILTVFYNGTIQRAHSYGDTVHHCEAAGTIWGSDTYYHSMFVIDPITLWLEQTEVYINPFCRLILPCDVIKNRETENNRGERRHGSCGFGLFAAVKRYEEHPENNCIFAQDLQNPYTLYSKLREANGFAFDEIYNVHNFMLAADYISKNCKIIHFDDLLREKQYDTIIYEGGQGLLLDQRNLNNFPHLTPSSVGMYNIANEIKTLNCIPELYYVSRTYMTRHGAGPMEAECAKEEINPNIIDLVNQPNKWQGSLRFGRINLDTLYNRIKKDAADYGDKSNINLVFTQLNYTNYKIETIDGRQEIIKPDFCSKLYVSDDKYYIHKLLGDYK